MAYVHEIRSITPAQENWYRVSGVRTDPVLTGVVVWAILRVRHRDERTGEAIGLHDDIVVGVVADDIGVSGNDSDVYLRGVAGYVRLTPDERDRVLAGSKGLDNASLIWD